MKIRRGDVVIVHLGSSQGTEIQKTRPAVVVSNDIANEFSGLITIVPLTSKRLERIYPFEVLFKGVIGLPKDSKAMVDQLRSVDRSRIQRKVARVPGSLMRKVDQGLKIHLALL